MTYITLYKRDMATERRKEYGSRMLFDRMDEHASFEEANRLRFANMPALMGITLPVPQELSSRLVDGETPYLAIAQHHGKYRHYDYTGDWDPLRTYDVVRAGADSIEAVVEALAEEVSQGRLERIVVAAEVRPSAGMIVAEGGIRVGGPR